MNETPVRGISSLESLFCLVLIKTQRAVLMLRWGFDWQFPPPPPHLDQQEALSSGADRCSVCGDRERRFIVWRAVRRRNYRQAQESTVMLGYTFSTTFLSSSKKRMLREDIFSGTQHGSGMPGTTPTARTMLWMVAWLDGFRAWRRNKNRRFVVTFVNFKVIFTFSQECITLSDAL